MLQATAYLFIRFVQYSGPFEECSTVLSSDRKAFSHLREIEVTLLG